MTTRTRKETVTFYHPFYLDGLDEAQPAGDYDIETDEELIQGVSFTAYQRTQTLIFLHSESGNPRLTRPFKIEPNQLKDALNQDKRWGAESPA